LKAHISDLLQAAATQMGADLSQINIVLERPKSAEHGDFATNLAMMLAKPLRQNPRAIAESLIKALPQSEYVAKVEIAGAGFINFFLNAQSKQTVVADIFAQGDKFGTNNTGNGTKVQVEFVSANPTGRPWPGRSRRRLLGALTRGNWLECDTRILL